MFDGVLNKPLSNPVRNQNIHFAGPEEDWFS